MSRVMKTSKLIESVRERAFVPKEDAVYNDQAIINILNEQIDTMLLPKLMAINEEHLVTSEVIPTTADTSTYPIPYRAVGNKLRDVAFKDGGNNYYEMSRISLEEVSDFRWNNSYSSKNLFYVENNGIKLVSSTRNDYEFIEMWYYLRPSVLVKDKLCATINSIDTVNGIVTLTNFPTDFAATALFDFVGHRTPNKILDFDTPIITVSRSAKTVQFAPEDLPSELLVGDFLCVAEESPVANIPTEYQPVLAQMAATFILEAMGDTEGLKNAMMKLDLMIKGVMQITDDRVEGAPQKINPRHTTMTSMRRGRGRF